MTPPTCDVGYWVVLTALFSSNVVADVKVVSNPYWTNSAPTVIGNMGGFRFDCPAGYVLTGAAASDPEHPLFYVGPTSTNPTYAIGQQGSIICAKVCN